MDERWIKCTPDRGQYLLGQEVRLLLAEDRPVTVTLHRLQTCVGHIESTGGRVVSLGKLPLGCYGVQVAWENDAWEGALDVVMPGDGVVRYGFLTDFSPETDPEAGLDWLRSLHISAVQFYDWMFRHDDFFPKDDFFSDPLGRKLSLPCIRKRILACRERGMRPYAYGAIYSASAQFFTAHPDWGMYTLDGKPMQFGNWLNYMNVAEESPWREHILREYQKAIAFGFQGIHMDTYGFPKHVWDAQGRAVELSEAFGSLIDQAACYARDVDDSAGVIFNAVNNWPVQSVKNADQDAVYIEVWPPNDRYWDLADLIRGAGHPEGRQVILAAYLAPFGLKDAEGAQNAMRLCFAAVAAAGGTQLLYGENSGILHESYYVNYAKLHEGFLPVVQKYCDYLVRYGELLYNDKGMDVSATAAGGINEDVCFRAEACRFSVRAEPNAVWTIIRESRLRTTIQLINLCGNDDLWNSAKKPPVPVEGVEIRLRLDRRITGIFAASPDGDSIAPQPLLYSYVDGEQGRIYSVKLPRLIFWATLWVETEEYSDVDCLQCRPASQTANAWGDPLPGTVDPLSPHHQ